jgi:hypothetical protein
MAHGALAHPGAGRVLVAAGHRLLCVGQGEQAALGDAQLPGIRADLHQLWRARVGERPRLLATEPDPRTDRDDRDDVMTAPTGRTNCCTAAIDRFVTVN